MYLMIFSNWQSVIFKTFTSSDKIPTGGAFQNGPGFRKTGFEKRIKHCELQQ